MSVEQIKYFSNFSFTLYKCHLTLCKIKFSTVKNKFSKVLTTTYLWVYKEKIKFKQTWIVFGKFSEKIRNITRLTITYTVLKLLWIKLKKKVLLKFYGLKLELYN